MKYSYGKPPAFRRCDTRKRRRKRAAFAGLQRQSPLTTAKGACGPFPCTPIKIVPFPVLCSPGPRSGQDPSGVLDRLGGLRKQSGRIIDAPAARAPGFWMQKVRKGAGGASLGGLPAPLKILFAKILRQNRRFLMSPRPVRPFVREEQLWHQPTPKRSTVRSCSTSM